MGLSLTPEHNALRKAPQTPSEPHELVGEGKGSANEGRTHHAFSDDALGHRDAVGLAELVRRVVRGRRSPGCSGCRSDATRACARSASSRARVSADCASA